MKNNLARPLTEEVQGQMRELSELFQRRGLTLGLAESCTGGLLSSWITSQAGVSAFFHGTVVSYSAKIKERILEVPRHTLLSLGEVSTPVALFMAKGARKVLEVDWALSITGVAGPSGGTQEKPVGFVCLAICGPSVEKAIEKYFDGQERIKIQRQSAEFALSFLLRMIR